MTTPRKHSETLDLAREVLESPGWDVLLDILRNQVVMHGNIVTQRARADDTAEILRRLHMIEGLRLAVTAIYRVAEVEPPGHVDDMIV
jgi:hypothetical protein